MKKYIRNLPPVQAVSDPVKTNSHIAEKQDKKNPNNALKLNKEETKQEKKAKLDFEQLFETSCAIYTPIVKTSARNATINIDVIANFSSNKNIDDAAKYFHVDIYEVNDPSAKTLKTSHTGQIKKDLQIKFSVQQDAGVMIKLWKKCSDRTMVKGKIKVYEV